MVKKAFAWIFLVLAASFLLATNGQAQQQPAGGPDLKDQQAWLDLASEVGVWSSRWEDMDTDGRVTGVVEGTESFTPFNGDRVLLLQTEVPGFDRINKAFRFYNPDQKKLFIIDVQPDGRHYILSEEVGSGVVQSEPFLSRDGRPLILRFTTVERHEGYRLIDHEISDDGGKSWRLFRRQTMEKQGS